MTRFPYDIFLSHQHADKTWARQLAGRLGDAEYNGRKLRPWLDESFLDPGTLGSTAELTTALDRSRILGIVLSPEAAASTWVALELQHFLQSRSADAAVIMLRRDCTVPAILEGVKCLDFRSDPADEDSLRQLLAILCPPTDQELDDVARSVDAAFEQVLAQDSGGFTPGTTTERDALATELVRHDIDAAGSEGLAVAAFMRAADRVGQTRSARPDAVYNCKMLLGECLAVAMHLSPAYRQVVRRFLDFAAGRPDDPTLVFVVARAFSKLAEIDIRLIDTSLLLRAVSQLDGVEPTNELRAIVALFARVTGKLRDEPAGELLIRAMAERGRASRIVAAGAIVLTYQKEGPVFYLTELQRLHHTSEQHKRPLGPPSRRLVGELFELDIDQDESVQREVRNAREQLKSEYPGIGFYYRSSWFGHSVIDLTVGHNTPFTGTIVKATLRSMDDLDGRVNPATVGCLTEPRIVDALFDGCGGLLILPQDTDSPQCRRLRARGVPFAMLDPGVMATIGDGSHVLVDERQVRYLKP